MRALAALALAPLTAAPLLGQDAPVLRRCELAGPAGRVELELGGARTALVLDLAEGERVELVVPFLGAVEGAESVELRSGPPGALRGSAPQPSPFAERARVFAAGLARRPPPPASELCPAPSAAALAALVAAGLLAALASRARRGGVVAACAALVASLIALSPLGLRPAPPGGLAVLEGDGSGRFVRVAAARDELEVDGEALFGLACAPPDARPALALDRARPSRWRALAPGAVLTARSVGPRARLDAGANELGDLEAVWLRPAGAGGFEARGPWPAGAPLPQGAAPAGEPPPGWLAGALPPGVPVLLARARERGGGGVVWVRQVGFSAESR